MSIVPASDDTDAASFERFFERSWPRLYRALVLLTGSVEEAEDIAQLAFLKVFERWASLEDRDDLDGYLFRTALNLRRGLYRRSLLAAKRTLSPGRADEDPSELVTARDEAIRSLRQLPERQLAAVVLTAIEGFDYTTAAGILRVKETTVRSLVARARARLESGVSVDDA